VNPYDIDGVRKKRVLEGRSGPVVAPRQPDCKSVVADPASEACRKQFCTHNPDDARCQLE
jgi:hypothetical protein